MSDPDHTASQQKSGAGPRSADWTPVTEFLSGGVRWRARTLAEGDRQICRFCAAGAGAGRDRLAPTSCSLAYDAPPQRRATTRRPQRAPVDPAGRARRRARPGGHARAGHPRLPRRRGVLHAEPASGATRAGGSRRTTARARRGASVGVAADVVDTPRGAKNPCSSSPTDARSASARRAAAASAAAFRSVFVRRRLVGAGAGAGASPEKAVPYSSPELLLLLRDGRGGVGLVLQDVAHGGGITNH